MRSEMKHSGIPWIGEIPSHWKIERIKTIFTERTELSEDGSEDLLSVSEYYGVDKRKERVEDGDFVSRSESLVGYKKCYKGDFVSNIMLAWKGSLGTTDYDGVVSPAYCVYKPAASISPRYYHYLFRTSLYTGRFRCFSKGIIDSRLRLYSPYFYNIEAIIPPLNEQQAIAKFLDRKSEEIDEMISLQEKIIDGLIAYKQSVITEIVCKGLNPNVQMKDSEIDWIGRIPEGWWVKRLKFSCEVFGRIGFRGYTTDDIVAEGEGAITLSPSNMRELTMDFSKKTYLSWEKYNESPEIMVYEGDVLMVKTGSSYGKCSYVDFLPMECTINPQIVVFKRHKDNAKYIAYYFQTPMALAFIKTSVVGGTIPTIAQEKIMNYCFAFPPLEEQNAIVDYLDKKCTEIDTLISLKQSKIEALKEYKQSIIYEYVTGKKEVKA